MESPLQVQLHFAPDDIRAVGLLAQDGRRPLFQFDPAFLARPLPLSPFYLPATSGVQTLEAGGGLETFGVFEDALPDGWGRRIIDAHFARASGRPPTLLERFACVGENGMGALTFHPTLETKRTAHESFDLDALAENALAFYDARAEDVLPELRRAGGSSGGARPKVFVGFNPTTGKCCAEAPALPDGFEHWIVKFATRDDGRHSGALEYAYSEIARVAGADMSPCRLLESQEGRFFATRRFDRAASGKRLHTHSAAGLLHLDFRIAGNEYADLFKLADALTHDYRAKQELFRRAALNVLLHNRDDHLKNFGFLMDSAGMWALSPFYDFTYNRGPGGWHTLSVAGEGMNPGEADLLRLAESVRLSSRDAKEILSKARDALSVFPILAKDIGISASVIKNITA